jgi:hypothetical protein
VKKIVKAIHNFFTGPKLLAEGLDWRYSTALKTLETTSTWMMSGDGCDR